MCLKKGLSVAVISVLLNACGSSSSSSGGENEGLLGIVVLTQFSEDLRPSGSPGAFGSGLFYRLDEIITSDTFAAGFNTDVDTCRAADDIDNDVSGLPDLDNLLRDVNAGETITFSDLAGTYATLQRTIDEDFSELGDATVYLSDSALTTPPQNLTVDISGGGFSSL